MRREGRLQTWRPVPSAARKDAATTGVPWGAGQRGELLAGGDQFLLARERAVCALGVHECWLVLVFPSRGMCGSHGHDPGCVPLGATGSLHVCICVPECPQVRVH